MQFTVSLNSHENDAYNLGYLNSYLDNYLLLKYKIHESKNNTNDEAKKRFFNALGIYNYSLFENLWHCYKASYSAKQETSYMLGNVKYVISNPFKSNLSSFSTIILLFGTCRDIYFVLLKLMEYETGIIDEDIFFEIITNDSTFKNPNRYDFEEKLKSLSNNDQSFVEDGLKIYDNNILRNMLAHSFRLPWWSNKMSGSNDFFILREFYDTFENLKESEANRLIFKKSIFNIIDNISDYESSIENSNTDKLISSSEILRNMHNLLSKFINNTFGYIVKILN
ncbi:MAG TPA: hypothetical protein PKD94_13520 [Ignavibacteria bacterium]|nr:hypothetical protein [Ignavibacteria bacterium]